MTIPRLENTDLSNRKAFILIDVDLPAPGQPFDLNGPAGRTIENSIKPFLLKGSSVILASYAGSSDISSRDHASLEGLVGPLTARLGHPVTFLADPFNDDDAISRLEGGSVILLENLLSLSSEREGKKDFVEKISGLINIFVNDSAGASRHPYPVVTELPGMVESCAGVNFYREMEILRQIGRTADRPFALMLGGVRTERKIKLMKRFFSLNTSRVDQILVGGGIAYTFLKSRANRVGRSFIEQSMEVDAFQIIEKSELIETSFHLPVDHIAAENPTANSKPKVLKGKDIPENMAGVDIGPRTISDFQKSLKKAQTIFWYGPMGIVESPDYKKGTIEMGKFISKLKAKTIVAGTDLIKTLEDAGLTGAITFVCPNSDSAVDFLLGEKLPGLEALEKIGAAE